MTRATQFSCVCLYNFIYLIHFFYTITQILYHVWFSLQHSDIVLRVTFTLVKTMKLVASGPPIGRTSPSGLTNITQIHL